MDKILRGIFESSHPENVKKLLLLKIRDNCTSSYDRQLATNILQVCLNYVREETSFNSAMAKEIFEKWALVNLDDGMDCLGKLSEDLYEQEDLSSRDSQVFYKLQYVLSVMKEAVTVTKETVGQNIKGGDQILERILKKWLKSENYDLLSRLSHTMVQHWDCFGKVIAKFSWTSDMCEKALTLLNKIIISPVLTESFSTPRRLGHENTFLEVNQINFKQAKQIASVLGKILETHKDHIEFILNKAFSLLASETELPGLCLAAILHHLPSLVIENAMHTVSQDSRIKEQNLFLVLNRIIGWLAWPFNIPIDVWIVQLMKALFSSERAHLVFKTIEIQALEVSKHLFTSGSQQETLTVLSTMLLCYQQSPDVFHRVLNRLVLFIQCIQLNDSLHSQEILSIATDLLHTLIYKFPGHEIKYAEALEVLKIFACPTEAKMKQWLQESASWHHPEEQEVIQFPEKPSSLRTGLRNLGNTCYINSVIQALFMLRSFQQEVLQRKWVPLTQPLSSNLQMLFSALLATKRLAINPRGFVSISRPPWFTKGSQQDCSEFLKYMLDRLEGEDSNSPPVFSPLHKLFNGECIVQTRCSLCHTTTSRTEPFNDFPLSFPASEHPDLDLASPKEPPSLKGGELLRSQGNAYHSKGKDHEEEAGSSQDSWMPGRPEFDTVTTSRPSLNTNSNPTDSSIQLEDLLANAVSKELLTGVNQYKCDACKSLCDAERQLYLSKLPTYLVFTLKRFTYDSKLGTRTKIMTHVNYPVVLNVPQAIAESDAQDSGVLVTDLNVSAASPTQALESSLKDTSLIVDAGMESESKPGGSERTKDRSDTSSHKETVRQRNFEDAKTRTISLGLNPNPLTEERSSKQISGPFYNLTRSLPPQNLSSMKIRTVEYVLRAVIIHTGTSSDSGHYYCLCRDDRLMSDFGTNLNAKRKCTSETQTHTLTSEVSQTPSSAASTVFPKSEKVTADDAKRSDTVGKPVSVRKRLSNDSTVTDSKWTLFNDSVTTPMDFASFSKSSTQHRNDTPYVLIYEEATNDVADFPSYIGSRDGLATELKAMLEADDELYAQELRASRKRGIGKMWSNSKSERKDDDEDQGPSGCGGSLGNSFDLNGGRFIF